MSAIRGVWPWTRFSGIVARYDVDFGIRDTTNVQYRFIIGILFFPGYRLILALRLKLVVELNRKDVCRGAEGPPNNLEQWVIVRCLVDFGLVQK